MVGGKKEVVLHVNNGAVLNIQVPLETCILHAFFPSHKPCRISCYVRNVHASLLTYYYIQVVHTGIVHYLSTTSIYAIYSCCRRELTPGWRLELENEPEIVEGTLDHVEYTSRTSKLQVSLWLGSETSYTSGTNKLKACNWKRKDKDPGTHGIHLENTQTRP